MQLFLFSKVKLWPHFVHLETDRRFEEKSGTHKTFLSSHWKSSLFEGMLILKQPLPTTLEASPCGFLTTD